MAVSKFYINSKYKSGERFDLAKFLDYSDNYDPMTSMFIHELKSLREAGVYVVQFEEANPALLSYSIYGNTQYWWILLLYNDKIDFSDLRAGDTIRYPSIETIEDEYFSLRSQQQAST